MKKLPALLVSFTIIASTLHAQAPELRNMMPNSWQKLTRLSEQEEKSFFEKTEVKTAVLNINNYFFQKKKIEEKHYQVFTETNSGLQFYRLLVSVSPLDTIYNAEYKNKTITKDECLKMQGDENCIWQIVFLKDKQDVMQRILTRSYGNYWASQGKWEGYEFNDLMIKPLNEKEIGFFITEVRVSFTVDRNKMDQDIVPINYSTCKGQIDGSNYTYFLKYNINDDINSVWSNDGVRIQASHYLFDPKSPLKYSIQNAFDGNPATSYVENTEDDLMKLSFPGYGNEYSGSFTISLINGYASNENLYLKNNRVKKIDIVGYQLNDSKTELIERIPKILKFEDGELNSQICTLDFICFGPFYFKVSSIYSGNTYNDTCIAELNFKDKKDWLFGEIDE